jgi:hypothetical protein
MADMMQRMISADVLFDTDMDGPIDLNGEGK